MAPKQPIVVSLGVLGCGLIGKALLGQLAKQTPFLLEQLKVDIQIVAISNSRKMLLSSTPLQGSTWQEALAAETIQALHSEYLFSESGQPANPDALARHVASFPGVAAGVLLDCTASDILPQHYATWLGQEGLHLITPNKKLGAGPLQQYQQLRQLQKETGKHFMYEATVGAGLPIISTLKNLIETGDRIISIEGVLSGTLSFIFNTFKPGMPFSEVVRRAKDQGYTEPDPREDLSGMDVARKVVILARECGLQLGLEDLDVSTLVPEDLAALEKPQEYMEQLHKYDSEMAAQADAAAAAGEVLRYVGRVDAQAGTASVSPRRYPRSHPFAALQGSDNIVVFTTERYSAATPLIIRGPGAGAEVTAAGVFGDLLQVMRSCGART